MTSRGDQLDVKVSYREFRQACRAFSPSELIPALARNSASIGEPPYPDSVKVQMPPWGLAAAARESLLYGNEYRSKQPDDLAIRALMRKFQDAADISKQNAARADFLMSIITRFTYEQFPWQESMFEEISRSHAWLIEGLKEVQTEVLTGASLAEVAGGMPLRDAIGATFLLQVGAYENAGIYDPNWLNQDGSAELLDLYPRRNVERIAKKLTTDANGYKAAYDANSLGTVEAARFDYNPLVSTPFVQLADGPPVAPAPRLILRTVTPGGLYYAGMAAYGQPFARDLGILFEHYVGRQLAEIDGAEVHPEIVYGKGGGSKSVDWFVVMPGLVLLVEVKSKRLGPAARAGDPTLLTTLAESLQKARKQLTRTVQNLAERNAAFGHIPADRPMLGIIVTAEPFYTGSAYLLDHDTALIPGGSLPDVPVSAASAREIESLVTHGAGVQDLLLELIAKTGDGVVGLGSVGKKLGAENRILAEAWKSYPWPSTDGKD